MDVHIVPGVKARNVADAHRLDLMHQEEFGCNCMTYWIDEARESIFCLIEAHSKEAVVEMHSRSHGLVPNKIIEVSNDLVESFLGRIYDPSDVPANEEGLKVFSDSSFRVLMVTDVMDPVLLQHEMGSERTASLLREQHTILRKHSRQHQGREVEHGGIGFIVSFTSAAEAVACALDIRQELPCENVTATKFKIAINAGEPVENSNKLFGDTIDLAQQMCAVAKINQLAISSSVRELISKELLRQDEKDFLLLSPTDEQLLSSLFSTLEYNWQNPDFDITDYCQTMAMSKSQLYRKTIALTGIAPNDLLKEFRLVKAKKLMKQQRFSISQITFDTGFASPSYFTKCFKRKFGILPMKYMDLLN
jgi:AraC-like DNA-binding protein